MQSENESLGNVDSAIGTSISRRTLLKTAALVSSAASLSGCEHLVSRVTESMGEAVPEHVGVSTNS
ncbi:MAG: twin-arginine translocation signal domain-containing protein, partial [Candidatus Melainabacteria bacterium]|nr:twin-arginine translocation signal domain-containing protein [Candidatus Melainabacteria bacterium]